jgi:transcriptional regulator with XRE-family HTH domain
MDLIFLKSTSQFSKWVLAERDKHKLSQRRLLKLAGLSHATMTKVGINTDLRLSTVAHIAHVFGYRLALVPVPLDDTEQKKPPESGGLDDTTGADN